VSFGQKTSPALQPNPQAPTLSMFVPLGAQRGSTLEMSLTGTNLADPTGLWTSFPAKITFLNDSHGGKDNAQLRVRMEVPKDAPLGFHGARLATTHGMSNLRLFCIDDLPQIMEVDSNRSKSTPQAVPIPCVVVGKADANVSAYYQVSVKAGQRVSFEVLGRRLGSAFDPQISLYDSGAGKELPGGHSNDAPGLQLDPRLTYTFKQAGEYLVEVRDAMYRGGPDYWYRLRIGDFPCATTPIPMAARRGSQVTVNFAGPAVEGVTPVEVAVPSDPTINTIWLAPRGASGLYGWPVPFAISDHEERLQQKPNNDPAHADRIPVPCGVTGRFLTSGAVDQHVFTANKGQRIVIEAQTQELQSPTEVNMVLKDAKGKQVATSDATKAPRIDFTAPADGDYILAVEHQLHLSGPSENYRITVTPYEPSFELSLGLDRFDVAPGSSLPLPIVATRRDYAGPIEVSIIGHPDISGHLMIPPGQAAQSTGTLYLNARSDARTGPYNIAIQGRASINGKTVIQYADLRTAIRQSLANLSFPPRNLLNQIALAVTEKPPFTLVVKLDRPEGLRGTPLGVTIIATRAAGFSDEIALTGVDLPANVALALKNIPKGQSEVKVELNPAANAALGQFPISVTGKAKQQGKEFSVTAPPVLLVLKE
jgi:hypothetical protein